MSSSTKFVTANGVDTSVGTIDWTSPGNIYANDSYYAVPASRSNAKTYRLYGSGCGFAIPTGATINGITVTVRGYGTLIIDTSTQIYRIWLRKADGSFSTSYQSGIELQTVNSDTVIGTSTTLWGETWTPADINDTDFGAGFQLFLRSVADSAYIDSLSVTVYYTAATGPANLKTVNGLATASVKTLRSGLLIASGKTWNGLT